MNNFFNSSVLFFVTALMALATLVQGMVALFEFLRRGHTRWILVLCMVVCLLIAGLAGYGALNAPVQASSNSPAQPNSSMIATGGQTPSPTSTTNTITPSPIPSPTPGKIPTSLAQKTYAEQEGSLGAPTFASPYSGKEGSKISAGMWVQVSCKIYAPTIQSASPDGYWYRIASSPWDNAYYAVANTFMNGDPWGGPYTHNTDSKVPNC